MLAQTVSKNCIKKPLSTRFRIGVIGGLMLAVCSLNVWAEPATNRYLQSRLIQVDEVGNVVIQTRKGDSLRVIAQQYSRVNNIPFARALEILQTTNASQFPNNDADQMLIGTQLVLPAKNQNSEPIAAIVSPPASVAETVNNASVSTSVTTETKSNTPSAALPSDSAQTLGSSNATTAQNSHSLRAQLNQFEDKLQAQVQDTTVAPYYAKLKSWFLAVPASLWVIIIPTIFLVWMVARLTRRSDKSQTLPKQEATQAALITEPPVELTDKIKTDENLAQHATAEKTTTTLIPADVIDGWMGSAHTKSVVAAAPEVEPASTTHSPHTEQIQVESEPPVQKSNSFVPPNLVSVSTVRMSKTTPVPTNTSNPIQTPLQTSNQPEVQSTVSQNFDKLKQVLNGLTADQLDLRSKEPMNQVAQTSEPRTEKIADVNGLLQQYAERATAKPTEHSMQYGVFKERVRLQKWMHAFDPDQLLTHAQAAHHAGQSEVAQHILNEVLLRGDAAQCMQALDLRNAWLTPTHRQTDNEAK